MNLSEKDVIEFATYLKKSEKQAARDLNFWEKRSPGNKPQDQRDRENAAFMSGMYKAYMYSLDKFMSLYKERVVADLEAAIDKGE